MVEINNSIEDLPAGPVGNTVLVGSNSNPVSVQLIQEIFNEITGKSDSLSKSFDKSYQISATEIQKLYFKIYQTLEQYNVLSQNCSFIIYYIDGTKDECGSFERFQFQNGASSIQVESVFIKYNLLIAPTKTNKTQSYTISIRVASTVAIRLKCNCSPPI